jgi:hypothetical protein
MSLLDKLIGGAPGEDGATWRDGASAPDNGVGVNGDYYLRHSNGDVYKRVAGVYSVVANIRGPAGDEGATADELTPIDLDLHETFDRAVVDFMPIFLIDVDDGMSDPTLTRFTTLSEGTPQTPTIGGGEMTLVHASGGDKNTGLQEGADIGMCQIASSLKIVSRSGTDTNAYENVGVGIAKDASNFILAIWRRKDGLASIQVKIGGSSNFRADVSAAGWTLPFEIGFSLVANSCVMWRRVPGGTWTKVTTYDVSATKNFKTSDISGWKGAFWLATESSVAVTFVFDDFVIGRFGSVGFRDPAIVSNEDGSPRFAGSHLHLTATCTDPTAAAYCGVFNLDLADGTLVQEGVIMVSRSGQIQNDNAAHLIAYDDATFRLFMTTWGNAGGSAADIQILYKNETVLDLLSGARLVGSMTQLSLPTIPGSAGAYDPHAIKVGGTWYLAHTIGPSTPQTFYPALASSADLSSWSDVGSDPAAAPYEGTRIVPLAGAWWVLSASALARTNVYDLTMTYQGKMDTLAVGSGGYPPHPMLVPYGQYIYQVTFDNALFSGVANTIGHFRMFRARRYGAHGEGV